MSTRSQVIIKDNIDEQWFYRHSDGYPSGNLPALYKFIKWFKQGKIRGNVEQSSGWLILIGAEEYGTMMDEKMQSIRKPTLTEPVGNNFESWKCGAYEICPCKRRHGDIEWLYTIDLSNETITIEKTYNSQIVTLTFEELKHYKKDFSKISEGYF